MDRSEVRTIVERAIGPLTERLGIPHWNIRISYDLREDDAHGRCTRQVDYNQAYIELDPDSFDDEAHVLKVLRHELFHVVLSPFDLYTTAVDRLDLGQAGTVLDRVETHAVEQAVINLERMYQGLNAMSEPEQAPDRDRDIVVTRPASAG